MSLLAASLLPMVPTGAAANPCPPVHRTIVSPTPGQIVVVANAEMSATVHICGTKNAADPGSPEWHSFTVELLDANNVVMDSFTGGSPLLCVFNGLGHFDRTDTLEPSGLTYAGTAKVRLSIQACGGGGPPPLVTTFTLVDVL